MLSLFRFLLRLYPADFFKLREVSLSIPVPKRLLAGATGANFTVSGHNVWRWLNKDFKTFVAKVHSKLPETEIVYLSLCPSIKYAKDASNFAA